MEFLILGVTVTGALLAAGLGAVGTVTSVEPLLPLSKGGLFGSRDAKLARRAIAAIQARLGDVAAGSLSIAEPEDRVGGLSVASPATEAGALSVAQRVAPEREAG